MGHGIYDQSTGKIKIGADFETADKRISRLEKQAQELRKKLTEMKIESIEVNEQIQWMIQDLDIVLGN